MTDRDHIDTLKETADPRRVAEDLGLRSRGKRFFCPSCQPDGGKTPDLALLDRGFICHKCGEKGDLLALVQLTAGLDFPSAVAWLEDLTGIGAPQGHKKTYRGKGASTQHCPPGPSPAVVPTSQEKAKQAPDPDVYAAFLEGCRPVAEVSRAWKWITEVKGVAPEVVTDMGVQVCRHDEYHRKVINPLKDRFGVDRLLAAGLLAKTEKQGGSFYIYEKEEVDFLVIPYFQGGRPIYLKARPPMSKAECEDKQWGPDGLVRFLNTSAEVPCLYNVDVLKTRPDRVYVCEGESDTWAALSWKLPAVGIKDAHGFKPEWVGLFKGFVDATGKSTVYLVPDTDDTGAAAKGVRKIADLFLRAGLPNPRQKVLPAGMDLSDYLNKKRKAAEKVRESTDVEGCCNGRE